MFQTPFRKISPQIQNIPKIKTLKQAVNQKLAENISTQKKSHQESIHSDSRTIKNKKGDFSQIQNLESQQLQLERIVRSYENQSKKGYIDFKDWINLNNKYFPSLSSDIINETWKILRIINYGEVFIPSGLVFEIFVYFLIDSKYQRKQSLRKILNNFLKTNKVVDSCENFRQLSYYRTLENVELQYCPHLKQANSMNKNVKHKNDGKVFERIFHDAILRRQKKINLKYQFLSEQQNEFKLKPSINYTKPQKINTKACERICTKKSSLNSNLLKVIEQEMTYVPLFHAKPVDQKIYQTSVESVPGAMRHIEQKIYCEAEKQRMKRFQERPFSLKNKL